MSTGRKALAEVRQRAFFLIGCERSGTTLLQAMLASHPRVSIASETQFYGAFYRRDPKSLRLRSPAGRERAISKIVAHQQRRGLDFDPQRFKDLARLAEPSWGHFFAAMLVAFREARNADRVGEKSPAHTPFLEAIASDFPGARFVHILRDPRAVVSSLLRVPFGSRFVAPNALAWRQAYRIHLSAEQLVGPDRYFPMRYEDLARDPRAILEQICDFLDLPWHDAIEHFYRREQPGFQEWEKPWKAGTMQKVFTSSIDAWKQRLNPKHIALVERALAEEMRTLGYEPVSEGDPWTPSLWITSRILGALEDASRKTSSIVNRRVFARYRERRE